MPSPALSAFLAEGLRRSMPHGELRSQALAVGWTEEEFNAAYAAAALESGVPAPERGGRAAIRKSSTVEIILNFFSFILLAMVAASLGVLLFQVINRFLPDPLVVRYASDLGYSTSAIHYAIAAVVVAFPLYYLSVRLWLRRFREEEAKAESRLTRWLTYLVLLAAAVTIVGDLIATLYSLLQGEITLRFLLKALTILLIAGAIFGFYFLERRFVQYGHAVNRRVFQTFGSFVAGFIAVAIVLGFVAGGSPSLERNRAFDAQRANDLSQLSACISAYAREFKRLPEDLSVLSQAATFAYCPELADPETGTPYDYRVVQAEQTVGGVREGSFELCATFALASEDLAPNGYRADKWNVHQAGRSCDTETVVLDKEASK